MGGAAASADGGRCWLTRRTADAAWSSDATATAYGDMPGSWQGHGAQLCGAAGAPDDPESEHGAEVAPTWRQMHGLSSRADQPTDKVATRANKALKLLRTATANIPTQAHGQVVRR